MSDIKLTGKSRYREHKVFLGKSLLVLQLEYKEVVIWPYGTLREGDTYTNYFYTDATVEDLVYLGGKDD